MAKTILLFFLLSLGQLSFSQYCALPTSIKSTSLYFIELPFSISDAPTPNYRFFYKVIIACDGNPLAFIDQLHISNPNDSRGGTFDYNWIADSSIRVTGQLDPCIALEVPPCYSINYYHTDVIQPDITKPFKASTTNCCRVFDAVNITSNGNYTDYGPPPPPPPPAIGEVHPIIPSCPPLSQGPVGNGIVNSIVLPSLTSQLNSSPYFTSSADSILNVCKGNLFTFPLKVVDPDGDSIAYHFSTPRTYSINATGNMVYGSSTQLFFRDGYSENLPAGPTVKLDQKTGLITGRLQEAGTYDITISVSEYRAGKVLDSISQDFYIKSYDCSILPKPKAIIPDSLNNCSSYTLRFPNYSIPQQNRGVNYNSAANVLWNFGDLDSSTEFAPTHLYADTGTYKVRLIVFPGLYCADTANALALVYPFVHAGFSYQDSCNGQPVPFMNTSSSTSGKIIRSEWSAFKDTALLVSSTDFNANIKFSTAPQTYHIFLAVRNEKGCVAIDSQWVNIERSPQPLPFHDTLLSSGASLPLLVDDGNFNFNGQYIWSPSYGLSDPFAPDPVLNSTLDMTYHVSVTNQFGCSITDSFRVKYYKGPTIYVPNAFSPNGDGKNDIFKPTYIGISNLKYFRVFTRYGQLVFETSQQLKGWDGNLHGYPASEGAYIWEVSGQDYLGKWQFQKGTVILVK